MKVGVEVNRHSRESGNPCSKPFFERRTRNWIPAFAGMTILFMVMTILLGCTPQAQFKSAKNFEKKKAFYKAWERYQEFAAKNPTHALAPEALFRAGLLSERKMGDCYMAGTFYENVLQKYPQADPWAKAALHQKENCPDYFPLLPGNAWAMGDSDTKGQNAKIQIECEAVDKNKKSMPSAAGKLKKTFFAGTKKVLGTEFIYRKEQSALLEFQSAADLEPKIILKWPLVKGTAWMTKIGTQRFQYEILDDNLKISVAGGDFKNCLRVRSNLEKTAGTRFDYYAPGVGLVLTTTLSFNNEEKRNTELLSYTLAEWPEYGGTEVAH